METKQKNCHYLKVISYYTENHKDSIAILLKLITVDVFKKAVIAMFALVVTM